MVFIAVDGLVQPQLVFARRDDVRDVSRKFSQGHFESQLVDDVVDGLVSSFHYIFQDGVCGGRGKHSTKESPDTEVQTI